MNRRALCGSLLFLTVAGGGTAAAHPGEGHDHKHTAPAPIDETAAKERARQEVGKLIDRKKVEASWADSAVKSVEKRTLKKGWEWLVTFENAAATKEKLLFVFLKPHGRFVAANFTGK